jgi:hypothetical protein
VAVLLVSIPWIAAELGFFLPDGIFIMRRVAPDTGGSPIAAGTSGTITASTVRSSP